MDTELFSTEEIRLDEENIVVDFPYDEYEREINEFLGTEVDSDKEIIQNEEIILELETLNKEEKPQINEENESKSSEFSEKNIPSNPDREVENVPQLPFAIIETKNQNVEPLEVLSEHNNPSNIPADNLFEDRNIVISPGLLISDMIDFGNKVNDDIQKDFTTIPDFGLNQPIISKETLNDNLFIQENTKQKNKPIKIKQEDDITIVTTHTNYGLHSDLNYGNDFSTTDHKTYTNYSHDDRSGLIDMDDEMKAEMRLKMENEERIKRVKQLHQEETQKKRDIYQKAFEYREKMAEYFCLIF
jgi:hypothetical protein